MKYNKLDAKFIRIFVSIVFNTVLRNVDIGSIDRRY